MLGFGSSGFAGSLALAILMMPVVVRSTEEMLKLVPNELREASLALGVPKWRTILKVVLPTAIGGITTGVMLAIARIAGETAPMLLLVFGSQLINTNPFEGAAVVAAALHLPAVRRTATTRVVRPRLGRGPGPDRLRHDPQPGGPRHRPLEGPEDRSLTRPSTADLAEKQ